MGSEFAQDIENSFHGILLRGREFVMSALIFGYLYSVQAYSKKWHFHSRECEGII